MAGSAEQEGRQPQKTAEQLQADLADLNRTQNIFRRAVGTVGTIVAVGMLYSIYQAKTREPLQTVPIEQIQADNKCEGTIMTIGDLRLRMPKTELAQQVVYSKDQTPPQQ
jgi:hypothetical protein